MSEKTILVVPGKKMTVPRPLKRSLQIAAAVALSAAGAPAKVKKELAGEALHWIKMGSSTYVNLCKSYMGGDYKIIG